MTKRMTATQRVLCSMMKENTGTHFLDSGGAYGRNWERNQKRNFMDEPATILKFEHGTLFRPWINYTKNVFWFLDDRLTYNAPLDRSFIRHSKRQDLERASWFEVLESWCKMKGYDEVRCINTYNGEDALSQVLQWYDLSNEDTSEGCIAVMLHNGCDVRGGYTRPYMFDGDPDDMYDNARGDIYCSKCWRNWMTDDTCNWYFDGCTAHHDWQLDEMEWAHIDSAPPVKFVPKGQMTIEGDTLTEDEYYLESAPVLYFDDDDNGYCPWCHNKLVA